MDKSILLTALMRAQVSADLLGRCRVLCRLVSFRVSVVCLGVNTAVGVSYSRNTNTELHHFLWRAIV